MPGTLTTADRLAIHDCIARYAWALDTGDIEGFTACFCRDGTLVWDAFEQPQSWQGEAALRHFASFFASLPTSAGRQHHVSNTIISPAPEGAAARSYVAVALWQDGGPHALHVMGWYEDAFRQEDGQWRLHQRTIRDWSGPILANFAGQTGERVARPMPPPLAGLAFRT
jgi:SnoaL-like domain